MDDDEVQQNRATHNKKRGKGIATVDQNRNDTKNTTLSGTTTYCESNCCNDSVVGVLNSQRQSTKSDGDNSIPNLCRI